MFGVNVYKFRRISTTSFPLQQITLNTLVIAVFYRE